MTTTAKKTAAPGPRRRPVKNATPGAELADPAGAEPISSAFNLDKLEREGGKEPFAFIHNGRKYALSDPQDQDWQKLILVVSNPIQFLRLVLRPEDVDAFFTNSMPTWKLRALTEAYREHFGLGELGESGGLSV